MYYTYVVRCTDDSLYTGIAADLQRRMCQHTGKLPAAARYTRSHSVIALEGVWRSADRGSASRLEYAIKRLPRQRKLQLLSQPYCFAELLPQLTAEDYAYLEGITLEKCLEGQVDD